MIEYMGRVEELELEVGIGVGGGGGAGGGGADGILLDPNPSPLLFQ